jgi:N-acetyl-anhydromuramyl-L-alanine amidase AmpD
VTLPKLLWRPSPNFSVRDARVDLLVLHSMEGSYAGSIAWFAERESNVSAHFCLRADGLECTQMVHLADKAWHVCAFNSRAVGLEMEGYEAKGFSDALVSAAAEIFAYLGAHLQIPVRHARSGVGPGVCSHFDLGAAGGGHHDPSIDPAFMDRFVAQVQAAYDRHDFPAVWDVDDGPKPCCLTPPQTIGAGRNRARDIDLKTVTGLQTALNALGFKVDVDGRDGPQTEEAVRSFQLHAGLAADGIAGPITDAAILEELSGG